MRQSIQKTAFTLLAISISALLSACGGGGGSISSNTTTPVATYKYQSAVQTQNTAGYSLDFNVSLMGNAIANNNCVGTGSITLNPSSTQSTITDAAGVTKNVYSGTYTVTYNLSQSTQSGAVCPNFAITTTSTYYFDSTTKLPVGILSSDGSISLAQSGLSYPNGVSVGDSGTIGTYTLYSDSTKTVAVGSETVTYSVTAGTDSSYVVIKTIDKVTDSSGQVGSIITAVSNLSSAGAMSLKSLTISYGLPDVGAILFTAIS